MVELVIELLAQTDVQLVVELVIELLTQTDVQLVVELVIELLAKTDVLSLLHSSHPGNQLVSDVTEWNRLVANCDEHRLH